MVRLRNSIAVFMFAAVPVPAAADDDTFFELKIRPVLAGTCFQCHGGKKISHNLRVDSRAALLQGGKSGAAIVPGDPSKSLLVRAIRYEHPEFKMPPDKRLPASAVHDFAAWIAGGAPWPETKVADAFEAQRHWAFAPVRPWAPPADESGWSANPIDQFILARLRAEGLAPSTAADNRTLLRRVYFDLIGLPPAPEQVAAFLADDSPDAYLKVVDRLLASPHYGERWGRHWMDVVRYADTAGDNADFPIPEARLYRDYIIDAFNSDKPYDQFVQEQIAGDILAKNGPREKHAERVIATGFLALSRRYATGPYELWPLTLEDTIETVGQAFLGLTLRCARCHDHKFDPITQEDYYGLYGIFASTQYPWAGAEEFTSQKKPREHFVPLAPREEVAPLLAAHQRKLQRLQEEIQRVEKEHEQSPLRADKKAIEPRLREQLERLNTELRNLPRAGLPADVPGAYAVQEGTPVDCPLHIRGEASQPGPIVKRNVPRFLAAGNSFNIPTGSSGRLQLAQWLTQPENPLTARVLVNRIWQHHFGKGLVGTPSNFGLRGEPPTHPELLDWLAARFVDSRWSIRAIQRLIVTSATYRQSSMIADRGLPIADSNPQSAIHNPQFADPANRWYWRYDRRRLDAEAIRDAILTASGTLDLRVPGAHPFPKIDKWNWTQHNPFKDVYPSHARSVYLMTQRFQRHPYLGLFDGPDTNTTTGVRRASTVPLQALYLMNNPFVREQAEAFARRIMGVSHETRGRIQWAHQCALSRPATPAECDRVGRFIDEFQQEADQVGQASRLSEGPSSLEAWTSFARILFCANEFVYVD